MSCIFLNIQYYSNSDFHCLWCPMWWCIDWLRGFEKIYQRQLLRKSYTVWPSNSLNAHTFLPVSNPCITMSMYYLRIPYSSKFKSPLTETFDQRFRFSFCNILVVLNISLTFCKVLLILLASAFTALRDFKEFSTFFEYIILKFRFPLHHQLWTIEIAIRARAW